jgi:hypothetical protein
MKKVIRAMIELEKILTKEFLINMGNEIIKIFLLKST